MEIRKTGIGDACTDEKAEAREAGYPDGWLCNIFGSCEAFRCRACGAELHHVNVQATQLLGYIIDHAHGCAASGGDSVRCENCAHYLGGIRCGR